MIAMALLAEPELLIADEPTTALDVTIQAQILELIRERTDAMGVGVILITHDLGVVARLADRVAVMYAGRVVEQGSVFDIFDDPRHPYTVGLRRSIPSIEGDDERLVPIPGMPPSLAKLPSGCPFRTRCPVAKPVCAERYPTERSLEGASSGTPHVVSCHETDADVVRRGGAA
jgi:peptide/nickel transport system ATP-binding protein/oligopeptide transport system ATP-binding protein